MNKIKRWNTFHTILMLFGAVAVLMTKEIKILVLVVSFSFAEYIFMHSKFLATFKPCGGYANWVSLFRLMLIVFGGIMLIHLPLLYCFPIFLLALCLDGLDGYLARKFNQSSDFGAYFDMETDASYVALLSTYWYITNEVGAWILFIGYLRYFYVIALKLFSLEGKKEKSTRFAKTIAVVLMSVLLAPFVLPATVFSPIIIVASLLTIYSFGVSFISRMSDFKE